MTNNFERVLGKGGFGMVYHGSVNGTEQVAVKMLSHSSSQGYKEFKAEVHFSKAFTKNVENINILKGFKFWLYRYFNFLGGTSPKSPPQKSG